MKMRISVLDVCLVLVALAAGSAVSAPASAEQLVGQGEWQSLSGEGIRGTWSVELTSAGERVEGTIKMTGSNVFTTSAVSGSIDGQKIVLGLMSEGTKQATFAGKLVDGSISGEWQCPGISDEGIWTGKLRSSGNGS